MKIKGFDNDLKCRGMQFVIGETYDTGAKDEDIRLCSDTVFHYCDSLQNVHNFYNCSTNNRYCEIKVLGNEITDNEKCGSNKIKIVREITGDELKNLKCHINGNAGLFNTGDSNTGNSNTGNRNTGNSNTGNRNAGNSNTGDWNTGDWNKTNNSCGFFNTTEENVRIFNCLTDFTFNEFVNSKYYAALCSETVILTEWINYKSEEMDTDKKKAFGGYFKKYDYKEAHKIWWHKLTDKNKKIIQEIPNFNAEIFKEITGIDVNND